MKEGVQEQEPETFRLADYRPPAWWVDSVALTVDLDPDASRVRAELTVRPNPEAGAPQEPLALDGRELTLASVAVDETPLSPEQYRLQDERLILPTVAGPASVTVETIINPQANTALEGLYLSGGNYCTQCEAEGFRRITYFPDRPDILARYTVTIRGSRDTCPVMLSNGNPIAQGELSDGRHWITWEDPFPKPSYLFALVAGDLACIKDTFTTRSGRDIDLRFYVQHHNADQCDHAMCSLQEAMRWDEETFGREYDLDIYMVVAVDDFNMGAMENKGLNVFNSRFVLARPDTATDADYQNIQAVIAHEYFHNWSGNRVTCRDWFQLSLKEGFTVFRDQEFTADHVSRAVKRIDDVDLLRSHQFPEDASPTAHPVQPPSYQEINNFYTVTVYEKGAELVRMLRNLLGWDAFRRGADLYFERHDGQAVTCEDFVRAMEDASGRDLSQFRRWYRQAGTPRITVRDAYDPENGTYRLTMIQHTPPTPDQSEKLPLHIPVTVGLLDPDGSAIPARLEGRDAQPLKEWRLELHEAETTVIFRDVMARPVPSLLRGFSAPARVDYPYTDEQLALLLAHDEDPFNRWDAGQRLAAKAILARREGVQAAAEDGLQTSYQRILGRPDSDRLYLARLLTLPGEEFLAEQLTEFDPVALYRARQAVRQALAAEHYAAWQEHYEAHNEWGPYEVSAVAMGRRAFKNLCLSYQMALPEKADARALAERQFREANNMTDTMAALRLLSEQGGDTAEAALEAFYAAWQHDALVVDKWLSVQAASPALGRVERLYELMHHPAFSLRNPNKVRALIGTFARANPVQFHAADGSGYAFIADRIVELDALNPQVAARLVQTLSRWRHYEPSRGQHMRQALERILASTPSRNVREIATKSVAE